MKRRPGQVHRFGCRLAACLLLCNACGSPGLVQAAGGIRTDGTVGTQHLPQVLRGTQVTVPQDLGTTAGANLFHSFSEFNVRTGQTVTFTGANNLQNVLARVTGGQTSNIDGTLRSQVGQANFYFINPAGVTFGRHAQVDVPAALHVSTADHVAFKDGARFSAARPAASTLSAAVPESFGFLGRPLGKLGRVVLDHSQIALQPGGALDVVANNINLNRASITVANAALRLVATRGTQRIGTGTVLPVLAQTAGFGGRMTIRASRLRSANGGGSLQLWAADLALVDSRLRHAQTDASLARAGDGIHLRADTLRMDAGTLSVTAAGSRPGGHAAGISLEAAHDLSLNRGSRIFSANPGAGRGGDILLSAGQDLRVSNIGDNYAVESGTAGRGTGGDITLTAARNLTLDGRGGRQVASTTSSNGAGRAGDVSVRVGGDLRMLPQSRVKSEARGRGVAGNVSVTVGGLLSMEGNGTQGGAPEISSTVLGDRDNPATVAVTVQGDLLMNRGALIRNEVFGSGGAGAIAVKVNGNLRMDNDLSFSTVTGISAVSGFGRSGQVDVTVANNLSLIDGALITNLNHSNSLAAGNMRVTVGGDLIMEASANELRSELLSSPQSNISSRAFRAGAAGDVQINIAGSLLMNRHSQIIADSKGAGRAGSITLRVGRQLFMNADSSLVSEAGPSSKQAGTIAVQVGGDATITGGSTITASTESSRFDGTPGQIDMTIGRDLLLRAGSLISSSAVGQSDAGSITIKVGRDCLMDALGVADRATGVFSQVSASGTGRAGSIRINAGNRLDLFNAGISTTNFGAGGSASGIASGLFLSARTMLLQHGVISAESYRNLPAGVISIGYRDSLQLRADSSISTFAQRADGGQIGIVGAGPMLLLNAHITSSVAGNSGNGGNISLAPLLLLLDHAYVQGNTLAQGGRGGNISLALRGILGSAGELAIGGTTAGTAVNRIQAAAPNGLDGTITVLSPQLNLSGALSHLPQPNFAAEELTADYCSNVRSSSLSYLGSAAVQAQHAKLLLF